MLGLILRKKNLGLYKVQSGLLANKAKMKRRREDQEEEEKQKIRRRRKGEENI
jgi:hypothetical protein